MMRQGFTLTELLVVIAIISGLTAVLLPATNMVRNRAKQLTCLNRVKQIAFGIEAYRLDNDSLYPYCTITDWSDANRPAGLMTAPYPPYAYDPYWGSGGGGFPFLWAALLNYSVTPPHPASGAMPNDWRCPARQMVKSTWSGASDPYMVLNNRNWQTSFIWNYPNAMNTAGATRGTSRARLAFDFTIPGWVKKDFMHGDGSISVLFADLHGVKESYESWTSLNPDARTTQGELANAWWIDGWKQ